MAVRYAWECPQCQGTIEISATQAGQDLECASCSAALTLPKLGIVKNLPVVGGAQPAPSSRRAVASPVKGWLFAGGLLLAVLGTVAGLAAQYRANQFHVDVDVESIIEEEYAIIDKQRPAELYSLAISAGEDSFALEYSETPYRTRNIKSGIIQKVAWVCWGLGGAGLLMLLSSFFIRRK